MLSKLVLNLWTQEIFLPSDSQSSGIKDMCYQVWPKTSLWLDTKYALLLLLGVLFCLWWKGDKESVRYYTLGNVTGC
jgi:hypothetical protein